MRVLKNFLFLVKAYRDRKFLGTQVLLGLSSHQRPWHVHFDDGTTLWDRMTYQQRWDCLTDSERHDYPRPPTGEYKKNVFQGEIYEEEGRCLICGGQFLPTHAMVECWVWHHRGQVHEECKNSVYAVADMMGV